MPIVLISLGLPAYVAAFIVLRAWALATIWGWILVPVFQVAPIGVPVAAGITALLALTKGVPPLKKEDVPDWHPVVSAVIQVAIALLVAWCAKQFI